jgi:hypothetical protein
MEFTLLRSCFSFPKLAYSLRTVDVLQHQQFLNNFDSAVRVALEAILGAPLTPAQWAQASLPIHLGGVGLRRAGGHGAAAYLSSLSASDHLVQEIRALPTSQESTEEATENAVRNLNEQLGDHLTYEEVGNMTQRLVSGLIDSEALARLQQATTTIREKARLNCVGREGAGDWLTSLPSQALGLHLRAGEFMFAMKYRLGMAVFRREGECPAPRCMGICDKYGDHAISCAIGGERNSRHNYLRDVVFQSSQQAHLGPLKEPDGLLPGLDDRPADILLRYWTRGKDTAIDITVVNALQAAHVQQVAENGSKAVESAHNDKVRKYQERCSQEGIEFVAMAVDTFGGWHPVALKTLTKLGRQLARVSGREEDETVRHLRQQLSVVLIRDNMAMLQARAPLLPGPNVVGGL